LKGKKMKKNILPILCAISMLLVFMSSAFGQESPVEKQLTVPGAKATLPVTAAKEPFSRDFVKGALDTFNTFHAQMGGDHTLYYLLNFSTVLRTDMSMPNAKYKPLDYALDKHIGKIKVKTKSEGELTLDDYIVHPTFRHQGILMLHKGKVVYEAYPGMSPVGFHWWASASKTITGLLAAMLVEEGKIDTQKTVTAYAHELAGTAWDNVRVIDLIHHTSGLDIEETNQSILDPQSMFVRFVASAMAPIDRNVPIENWVEVLREAEPLENEKPGERFRYSSLNTQVLGMVIENVSGLRFADVVEKRIWGKLRARMPLLTHLAPDGTALNMAIISSTLQDMARFGALWMPSWKAVATERVVTTAILKRIRKSGDPTAFKGGKKEEQAMGLFGEKPVKASYQFDFIFEDGAMYKHGNLGQGIYLDPERDFVGVYFSITPYVSPYGEIKVPAYMRAAARMLAGH
jgi:CubicO group peptidase (beta-lactamase class C family)